MGKVDLAQGPQRVASAAPSEWPMQRTSSTSAGAIPEIASHVARMLELGVVMLVTVWKAARKPSWTWITHKLQHYNCRNVTSSNQQLTVGIWKYQQHAPNNCNDNLKHLRR